jgi:hypothetical protein
MVNWGIVIGLVTVGIVVSAVVVGPELGQQFGLHDMASSE